VRRTTAGVCDAQFNDNTAVDHAAWHRLLRSNDRLDREVFSVRVERVCGTDVEPLWGFPAAADRRRRTIGL
jgi:hypothetical protein